jgi:hypothetical protein
MSFSAHGQHCLCGEGICARVKSEMINSEEKRLEHIIRRMTQDTSVDAPVDSRLYVKNLFRTRAVEPKTSAIRRLVAAITMELSPDRAAFGERSGSASATRQMLFEAGEAAVDLRIETAGIAFNIRGQILGDGFAVAEATLAGNGISISATLDEIGGFRFTGVKAGEYNLTVTSSTDEIFIESLRLQ